MGSRKQFVKVSPICSSPNHSTTPGFHFCVGANCQLNTKKSGLITTLTRCQTGGHRLTRQQPQSLPLLLYVACPHHNLGLGNWDQDHGSRTKDQGPESGSASNPPPSACPQGKVQKKKLKKKLTNVSFMYVCVAGNSEMLVFFSFFPPTIV